MAFRALEAEVERLREENTNLRCEYKNMSLLRNEIKAAHDRLAAKLLLVQDTLEFYTLYDQCAAEPFITEIRNILRRWDDIPPCPGCAEKDERLAALAEILDDDWALMPWQDGSKLGDKVLRLLGKPPAPAGAAPGKEDTDADT